MKIHFLFLIILLYSPLSLAQSINTLRNNYPFAVADKSICQEMIRQLNKKKQQSTQLAYLGAYQTIWANHTSNPLKKLATFNKGKKNIDDAIDQDPESIEIRFLRWSVQKNAPRFLGYHKNIESDEKLILKHLDNLPTALLDLVKNLQNQEL